MSNLAGKILLRNISSLFIIQIANYLLPMVSIPIVVRIIGPEKFGLINYAGAIVAYFVLLINYGFNLTATRRVAQHPHDRELISKIFSEVLSAKVLLFVISLFVFAIAFVILPEMRNNWQVMWFSFLICLAWVFTPDWLFQGVQQLHKMAYFNLFTKIIFTIVILCVINKEEDYYLHPFAISIAQLLVGIFSWRYAIKKFKLQVSWTGVNNIREILWQDRIVFFSSVVVSLYTTTNTVILATIANSSEVGYFTAAQRFIGLAQSVISIPLAQSLFPYVGKSFGISKEEGLVTVRKIALSVAGITFFCSCILWFIGPWVIGVFYGNAFQPSQYMFRIMAFVPFIVSLSNLFGVQVMLNLHMDKAFLRITAAGAVLSLILNGALTESLGGIGASYATLITECFITLMMGTYLFSQDISIIQFQSFHPSGLKQQVKVLLTSLRK